MKQLFFAFILALAAFSLQAQTEKGRFMLSMHNFSPLLSEATLLAPTNSFGLSFGNIKDEFGGIETESSYFSFGLEGSGHYFVIDNLSAGLNLGFFNQKVTEEDDEDNVLTALLFGPELRYYFPVGANSKVYLRGGASWGNFKYTYSGEEDDPTALSQYGGGVGFAVFLANNFSLNIGAGYAANIANLESDLGDYKSTTSGVTIDLGFSAFLGGNE